MDMLRIRVDFNSLTPDAQRVPINEHVQPDIEKFTEGNRVIVYEPGDLEVEAILERFVLEDGREVWDAIIDWPTRRNLS